MGENKVLKGLAQVDPSRRNEISKQGALARWGHKATHKGNFKEEFGIDVDCYILDDNNKTAVINQSDMGAAIGLVRRGSSLPDFLNGEKIAPFLGGGLREKFENPIKFQWRSAAANGFNIEYLIDVCDAVIRADFAGVLTKSQAHVAKQANIIRTASAKQGIKQLAWAVAGYDATREDVINSFKQYIEEEAMQYAKEFPRSLFEGWCKIYDLRETKINHRFSYWEPKAKFKKLVLEHIYHPLAGSDGAIKELILRHRESGKRLFQYLSDEYGKPALRTQLGKILGLQAGSLYKKDDYEKLFTNVFGKPPPSLD